MRPSYIASVQKVRCDSGNFIVRVCSLHIHPGLHRKQAVRRRNTATIKHAESCPPEQTRRSTFEILAAEDTAVSIIKNTTWGERAWLVEESRAADACALTEKHQDFHSEISSHVETTEEEYSTPIERERAKPKFGSPRKDQALGALIQSRLLTIPQAAAYLNTTKWAIRAMIWSRELPIVPLGKRYMLDTSDLDGVVSKRKRLV